MKPRRTKQRWLTARVAPRPSAEPVYALGLGPGISQRWRRGCISAAAEPIERHRLVWASRRDDGQLADCTAPSPWSRPDTGNGAEIPRKA